MGNSVVKIKIANFNALQAKLKKLPIELRYKVERGAVREAAEVVRDEARSSSAFEDRSGRLRRSIKTVENNDKYGGGISYHTRATAPHAWLVENGSAQGQRPRLFMATAYLSSKGAQLQAAVSYAFSALLSLGESNRR